MDYHTSCKLFWQKLYVTKFIVILARNGLLIVGKILGLYS